MKTLTEVEAAIDRLVTAAKSEAEQSEHDTIDAVAGIGKFLLGKLHAIAAAAEAAIGSPNPGEVP